MKRKELFEEAKSLFGNEHPATAALQNEGRLNEKDKPKILSAIHESAAKKADEFHEYTDRVARLISDIRDFAGWNK